MGSLSIVGFKTSQPLRHLYCRLRLQIKLSGKRYAGRIGNITMTDQTKIDKFNQILRGLDLVLMNNIAEVDPSVWENWLSDSPLTPEPCEWFLNDSKPTKRWCCNQHMYEGDETEIEGTEHPEQCDFADSEQPEVYQWFACSDSDADFLKRHNQFVTYSGLLDTHFLAITHFGTAWSYTGMVDDFVTE